MCSKITAQGPPNYELQTGFKLALLFFLYSHRVCKKESKAVPATRQEGAWGGEKV
jgi:hypothetical protein